jgi:hypothetical protein
MMLKVKPNNQIQGVNHQRIKSSNDGALKQTYDQSATMGIPSEYDQNSQKNLKITFVGEQALLKQHKQSKQQP